MTTVSEGDRELLELAAKAAGMHVWRGQWPQEYMLFASPKKPDAGGKVTGVEWNPLTDDGDAFRLAVKLRLCLIPLEGGGWDVERYNEHGEGMTVATCANGGAWALRECIVRAAASIGKEKQ